MGCLLFGISSSRAFNSCLGTKSYHWFCGFLDLDLDDRQRSSPPQECQGGADNMGAKKKRPAQGQTTLLTGDSSPVKGGALAAVCRPPLTLYPRVWIQRNSEFYGKK